LIEGKYLRLFTQLPYENTETGEQLIENLLVDPDIKKVFNLN
jgi:hypothetical protein